MRIDTWIAVASGVLPVIGILVWKLGVITTKIEAITDRMTKLEEKFDTYVSRGKRDA